MTMTMTIKKTKQTDVPKVGNVVVYHRKASAGLSCFPFSHPLISLTFIFSDPFCGSGVDLYERHALPRSAGQGHEESGKLGEGGGQFHGIP